jgi:hypothetical protein
VDGRSFLAFHADAIYDFQHVAEHVKPGHFLRFTIDSYIVYNTQRSKCRVVAKTAPTGILACVQGMSVDGNESTL